MKGECFLHEGRVFLAYITIVSEWLPHGSHPGRYTGRHPGVVFMGVIMGVTPAASISMGGF